MPAKNSRYIYIYIYRYNPLDRYGFPILVGNRSFSYYLVLSDILWKCVKASNISVGPYQIRIDNVGDYFCTCRMGASNLKLILISFTWDCTTFHNFFSMLKKKSFLCVMKMPHGDADIAMRRYQAWPLNILIFKKLAGLWWAGEVVNHVWIYGSKVAEGSSAFQYRSCFTKQHAKLHIVIISNK